MMDLVKLVVKGSDARNFLQGQLTADMDHLDYLYDHEENSGLAGLCNIKGRLEAVFWIRRLAADEFDLYVPACIGEEIATLLKRFLFRSKVTIDVVAVSAEEAEQHVPTGFVIPWIIAQTRGKHVPQMVSLDVLKGVHPRKGCYIGQEIVTRLRDLGKNKKRLGKISLGQEAVTTIGDTISVNDKIVGEILLVEDQEALAVMVLAELAPELKVSDSIQILNVWKNDEE